MAARTGSGKTGPNGKSPHPANGQGANDDASSSAGHANGKDSKSTDGAIIIKKYANRRLYNTATSSYVTLDYLSELVKEGIDFVVYDAKTGEDITRPVLTQIIFEQENKGQNLLPVQFLRQLIKFYGDSMQTYVPSYLEMSMDAFSKNQESFKQQMDATFGANPGYRLFEDTVRKNMALYGQAMKMFAPTMANQPPAASPSPDGSSNEPSDDIEDMKRQLAALQEKLSRMES